MVSPIATVAGTWRANEATRDTYENKLTAAVHHKAQTAPFAGAFDFRGGDIATDPLRQAAVLAVVMGLEDVRATRRAA